MVQMSMRQIKLEQMFASPLIVHYSGLGVVSIGRFFFFFNIASGCVANILVKMINYIR